MSTLGPRDSCDPRNLLLSDLLHKRNVSALCVRRFALGLMSCRYANPPISSTLKYRLARGTHHTRPVTDRASSDALPSAVADCAHNRSTVTLSKERTGAGGAPRLCGRRIRSTLLPSWHDRQPRGPRCDLPPSRVR